MRDPALRERLADRGRMAFARTISTIVTRAPAIWPVLRAPVRGFFDDRAEDWDDRTSAGSADHLAPLAAALVKVSPTPERALDIGTGTGTAALLLAREFPAARVRGVDLSPQMIQRATRRVGLDPEGRVAFKVADASSLPFPDAHFDLVIQLNMPPFYAEIKRVLRPGCQAIVASSWGSSTPFYSSEDELRRGFAGQGFAELESGSAAGGTWFIARRGP